MTVALSRPPARPSAPASLSLPRPGWAGLSSAWPCGTVTWSPTASRRRSYDLLAAEAVEETREFHHSQTQALDPETGQADAHVAFAFAAHRAVVDVDTELGLVKVVEIATAQDVGKAINPQAVEGQIEGGIAQGLGLAVMEEIQVADGKVRNPSFTDYLIPTVLDMSRVRLDASSWATPTPPTASAASASPPTISSTPAIVAAIRAATGRPHPVPVRPEHIVDVPGPGSGEASRDAREDA